MLYPLHASCCSLLQPAHYLHSPSWGGFTQLRSDPIGQLASFSSALSANCLRKHKQKHKQTHKHTNDALFVQSTTLLFSFAICGGGETAMGTTTGTGTGTTTGTAREVGVLFLIRNSLRFVLAVPLRLSLSFSPSLCLSFSHFSRWLAAIFSI